MKRGLALAAALIVTIGVTMGAAVFAGAHIIRRDRAPGDDRDVLDEGRPPDPELARSSPRRPCCRQSAPIIVVLTGKAASNGQEIRRDRLVPYVDAGKTELVYPLAIRQSWNAIGCCGAAARHEGQRPALSRGAGPSGRPGARRPIYFVGYSNGGRMAYRLACADPGLFDGMAAVKADPMPGCVIGKPENVLVVSSRDDPSIAVRPGDKGRESPRPRSRSPGCRRPSAAPRHRRWRPIGSVTFTTWRSCADGTRLAWGGVAVGRPRFPAAHRPCPRRRSDHLVVRHPRPAGQRFVKRGLVLAAAFLVTIGVAVFAGVHIISAVERPSTTTTYSIRSAA